MSLEWVAILGVLVVVAAATLAPKVGVAAPLLLVGLGYAASLLPFVDRVVVNPEWVLAGVLPPLLYSAAVNAPAMEFRRDFRLISAFSVILVVASAVGIGLVVSLLIPGLPLGIGIALGAIISPTDAVATSIVRQAGVSARIVTVLDGESMLNDASALVLLRSAVAASGVAISLWQVAGEFAWAVAVAAVIGFGVGKLNLAVRSRIGQVPPNVAISLVVPFLAYLPAEHLGASGLVAAVTAGLVSGHGAPRKFGPEVRLSERAVWRTVELLLESAVFLLVGLELSTLAADLTGSGGSFSQALGLAVVAATLAIGIRAGFVALSVWLLARRNRRGDVVRERLGELQDQLADGQLPQLGRPGRRGRADRQLQRDSRRAPDSSSTQARIGRWQTMVVQRLADLDYLAGEQFGWRHGVILTWAGMRGAVTIAAAQSLPSATPNRSLLVLVATLVAVGTLVVQGSTLSVLADRLGVTGRAAGGEPEQWTALQAELTDAALTELTATDEVPAEFIERTKQRLEEARRLLDEDNEFSPSSPEVLAERAKHRALRLQMIQAQRDKLLAIRDLGTYPSAMLDAALAQLDADQLGIELRGT